MMNSSGWFFLLFVELFALFFLSAAISRTISLVIYRITRSQHITIMFLATFFLPGVILHEMSHYLAATVLGVQTGRIEFMPEIQGDRVKLGSVQVAQSDIIRRSIIGVAPLLVGFISLYGLSYISSLVVVSWETIKTILVGYSMFLIGNTMFSSKKDMEGVWIFLVIIGALLGVTVYFFRNQSLSLLIWLISHQQFFLTADMLLLIPIGIDILVVSLLSLFKK